MFFYHFRLILDRNYTYISNNSQGQKYRLIITAQIHYDGVFVKKNIRIFLAVYEVFLFIQLFLGCQTLLTTNFTILQPVEFQRWSRRIALIFL